MKTLLLGLGTHSTGDHAVGRVVAQRLASHGCRATIRLVGDEELEPAPDWAEHDRVIIVEATTSGRPPGTIHRAEHHAPPGAPVELLGDHAATLEEIIQRAGHLPQHLEVLSVCVPEAAHGDRMSDEVEAAADRLVVELKRELNESAGDDLWVPADGQDA